MSARTAAARRPIRTAAATAVVAAVAGTVLMPLAAHAAPAAENLHALKITMGAADPSGPLTRGGATESFELTVTNPTDKAHSFHPWINGTPAGHNPLQKDDVLFKVEAASGGPETESSIGFLDGEWQGLFRPAGKGKDEGFEVPAGGKLVWKVTIGLAKTYPTNDGDFTLRTGSFKNEVAEGGDASLIFKTDPAIKAGSLETWFDKVNPCQEKIGEYQCREMDLHYRASGDGEFGTALATEFDLSIADGTTPEQADLQLQVQVDGKWQDLAAKDNYRLADIKKGFGKASGERIVHLRSKLGAKSQLKKETTATLRARVALAEGNTYPFTSSKAPFQIAPAAPTSPSPSPSPSASTTTSPSPTPSATASTTAAAGNTNTTVNGTSGSLANTGADSNIGLYSALAVALVAGGGVFAWMGARRRRPAADTARRARHTHRVPGPFSRAQRGAYTILPASKGHTSASQRDTVSYTGLSSPARSARTHELTCTCPDPPLSG